MGKYKNRKTGKIIIVYKIVKEWYYNTPNKIRGIMHKNHIKENYIKIS